MFRHARLIGTFLRASLQQEMAYRTNLLIGLLHTLLNLGSGIIALWVLFGQVKSIHGWSFGSTLALLGVYLTVGALRSLVIGPSLDALTGMDGEVWDGRFDFTLLRPADIQFLASVRHWRLFAVVDLLLAAGVLVVAVHQLGRAVDATHLLAFAVALGAGVMTVYALLLFFAGLVFWSPGFLFSWVFDGLFQLARYPVGLYPAQLRLILTWVIPVGVITTIPAQALTGVLSPSMLAGSVALAVALVIGASAVFRAGVRRYASASS